MDLRIETYQPQEAVTVLTLTGELDCGTFAPACREIVRLFQAGHCRVVLDLADLAYADSSLLKVVVIALKVARQRGGSLKVVAGENRCVLRLLQLSAMGKLLAVYRTREAAIAGLLGDPVDAESLVQASAGRYACARHASLVEGRVYLTEYQAWRRQMRLEPTAEQREALYRLAHDALRWGGWWHETVR